MNRTTRWVDSKRSELAAAKEAAKKAKEAAAKKAKEAKGAAAKKAEAAAKKAGRDAEDLSEHETLLDQLAAFANGLQNNQWGMGRLRRVLQEPGRGDDDERHWLASWFTKTEFTLKDFAVEVLLQVRRLIMVPGWLREGVKIIAEKRQVRLFGPRATLVTNNTNRNVVELSAFYEWLRTGSKGVLKEASKQCAILRDILSQRIGDFRFLVDKNGRQVGRAWYEQDLEAGRRACRQVRVHAQPLRSFRQATFARV
jgi:hypothetical protein